MKYKNVWLEILLYIAILLIVLWLAQGCVLYRHDVEDPNYRDSRTLITLFKDFDISLDPNAPYYKSKAKNVNAVTPYGPLGVTDE